MDWLPPSSSRCRRSRRSRRAADVPDLLFWSVAGPTALGWMATYILAIRVALRDRLTAIPAPMVAVNFAWEFSLTFVLEQTETQRQINFVWFVFNLALLYLAMRYGPRDYPALPARTVRWALAGVLVWAAVLVVVGANELHDRDGMYTGMIIQVPLSASFLLLLKRRGSSAGQSMHIAVVKCAGSLAAGATAVIVYPPTTCSRCWCRPTSPSTSPTSCCCAGRCAGRAGRCGHSARRRPAPVSREPVPGRRRCPPRVRPPGCGQMTPLRNA